MKIIFKAYRNTSNSKLAKVSSYEKFINEEDEFLSKQISIKDVVNNLENNPVLNYPYDFLNVDGSGNKVSNKIYVNLLDNIVYNKFIDIRESYNPNNGEINLTEKLLYNKNILPIKYNESLHDNIGEQNLFHVCLLHEIGHALQHQLNIKNKNIISMINDDDNIHLYNVITQFRVPLFDDNDDNPEKTCPYSVVKALRHCIEEGFADLYCCASIYQIYDKVDADKIVKEIIFAREEVDKSHYHILNSLKKLVNEIDKVKFNNFEDLVVYIEKTVLESASKVMEDKLRSNDSEQVKYNNVFLGFFKYEQEEKYGKQLNNILDGKAFLEYLGLKNNDFINDTQFFNLGYAQSLKNWGNLHTTNNDIKNLNANILKLRSDYLDKDEKFITLKI